MFASWLSDLSSIVVETTPFPHAIIDNFFTDDTFQNVSAEFGPIDSTWHRYWNPLEKKYALRDVSTKPHVQCVFDALQTPEVVSAFATLFDIPDLEADPTLHGAGLHYHPRGGKLDMHLDYSIHPFTGKERRLNLIVYLNDQWDPVWGGALEMWDSAFTECSRKVVPFRNRAVLFRTSDISYHGMPHPIECPDAVGRRSLAMYYVSPPRDGVVPRPKAEYRPLPTQSLTPQHAALYEIRSHRLIQDTDLWANWE